MSIDITMPRLSDTMESGTIIKWNVQEGDDVSAGDAIADIETDKATMEMQVYDDGKIAKIVVPEGKNVNVGTIIAVLSTDGKAADHVDGHETQAQRTEVKSKPDEEPAPHAQEHIAEQRQEVQQATAPRDEKQFDRVKVSPVARRLAEEYEIDLSSIEGSGPSGRIIKRDVMKVVEAADETAAAVAPSARQTLPVTRVSTGESESKSQALAPLRLESKAVSISNMRQTIAKRLVESKTTIPHYQVSFTFNMDHLLELRESLNEQLGPQQVKLSVNDFLVRSCALAMYEHPEFNASWGGDHIKYHGEVNIGIAISIPRERGGGLVVGTIRHADQKGLRTISYESRMLAEKARTRGLTIEEMSDSTFTLSNLGMFGVDNFTAIINPPNSAILAVGSAVKKPIVKNGELTIGNEMSATLSSDHRIIDGAMSAQYLKTLKDFLENPATLLV